MKLMESSSFAVLDSHQRMLDRQKVREENARAERELTQARLSRVKHQTAEERVFTASKRLEGTNAPTAIALIESKGPRERDFYLLAEELFGQNRKQVLRQFAKPRKSIRESILGATNESPESATQATVGQPVPEKNPSNQSGGSFEGQPVGKNGKPLFGAALAAWRRANEPQVEE